MRSYLSKNEKRSLILAVCILPIFLMTGCGRIYDLYAVNNQIENESGAGNQVESEVVAGSPEEDSTKESSADVQKEENIPPKIYWTLPVGDYEVFLQDGAEEETLDLWVNRKGEKQVVHTYKKNNADYQEPEDITGDTFEDVLGHDGFRIYRKYFRHTRVDYYAMEEEMKLLAYYWGVPGENIYQVDVDGDGTEELICNVMWMADGVCDTLIYHFDGEKVLMGEGTNLLQEEYDDRGAAGMIESEYLPEKNKVLVHYHKDGQAKEKEYDIDLEQLKLYEVPQNV